MSEFRVQPASETVVTFRCTSFSTLSLWVTNFAEQSLDLIRQMGWEEVGRAVRGGEMNVSSVY